MQAKELQSGEMSKFEISKKNLKFWARGYILFSKSDSMADKQLNFFRPQNLTSGSLAAPWATRIQGSHFERSMYIFLHHVFFKKCITALLRGFTAIELRLQTVTK